VAAERPWTLFVYGAADNNADGPILAFLDSIRDALDGDPGMELVLYIDRSEGFSGDAEFLGENFTGARLYRLGKDSAERLAGGEEFPEITLDGEYEPDSADATELGKFLRFGKKQFPAQHYGLMIYSHADGQTMCPDEQSERSMGIAELTDVVTAEESVDFLALELCNMAGIEIAYQWRPGNGGFSADVLVAIPNAGPPLDWNRAFARIRSSGHPALAGSAGSTLDPAKMSAADFGRLVIEEGELGRQEHIRAHPDQRGALYESAGVFDLAAALPVKRAVDALAVSLARSNAKAAFEELRGPGARGITLNYVHDELREYPYVDLYTLCAHAAECDALDTEVRARAQQTMQAVDAFVLASFGLQGLPGFEAGKSGIFLVFPDGDAVERTVWKERRAWASCAWYSPQESIEGEYRRWAWCADGATAGNGKVENWYELLDSWYDEGADGGCNGYAW
jgi:clostripain